MRIVTWNCRIGAFRHKAARIAPLAPDVLIVQEAERLDGVLVFAGERQPTFRDRIDPPVSPRGLATLSYTAAKLTAVDVGNELQCFRRYEGRIDGLSFNLVAAWSWATKSAATNYRQVHEGLRTHAEWIKSSPTILAGDLNDNARFKGRRWTDFIALVQPLGLVSAYHRYFGEAFGAETRPTHYHGGKRTAPFHLDYCFVPESWAKHIVGVDVGSYDKWHEDSDHMPLVVDVDPPNRTAPE